MIHIENKTAHFYSRDVAAPSLSLSGPLCSLSLSLSLSLSPSVCSSFAPHRTHKHACFTLYDQSVTSTPFSWVLIFPVPYWKIPLSLVLESLLDRISVKHQYIPT